MPQTTAAVSKELSRQSADCSFILSHLVRQNGDRTDDDAKKILSLILNVEQSSAEPFLKSSSTGWYSSSPANIFNPTTRKFDGVRESAVVCFTESTLSGLKAHRDVFNAKYGLAFDREFVFSKGANPCLNIRESIFKQTFTCNEELFRGLFITSSLRSYTRL